MTSFYAVPPAADGNDWTAWLKQTVGDFSNGKLPKRDARDRRGLVLIGNAVSCLRFLPLALSAEVLKREEMQGGYSIEALKVASENAALVIVHGVQAAHLARDYLEIQKCLKSAHVVFVVHDAKDIRALAARSGVQAAVAAQAPLLQSNVAEMLGLEKKFFVVQGREMQPLSMGVEAVVSASAVGEKRKQLDDLLRLKARLRAGFV